MVFRIPSNGTGDSLSAIPRKTGSFCATNLPAERYSEPNATSREAAHGLDSAGRQ